MKFIIFLLSFFVVSTVFANYSPYLRTGLFINAILSNSLVAEQMDGAPIDSITRDGNVFYIKSGQCMLEAEIADVKNSGSGPASSLSYKVIVGSKVCN